jgi:hypothetical protein
LFKFLLFFAGILSGAVFLIIIGFVIMLNLDNEQFEHPSFDSAQSQIQRETGLVLSREASLLFARRSNADLRGDHDACFLVQLSETEFISLNPPHEKPESAALNNSCPAHDAFNALASMNEFELWSYYSEVGGKQIIIYTHPDNNFVVITMNFW